jgi:pimeloyl-ACP methyl ester carboxylesterase
MQDLRHPQGHLPAVSGRWILGALLILLTVGLACAWATLCLLYWQGSWQLLYHPKTEITRTPEAVGVPFEAVKFAATETGVNRLSGWWVPAEGSRFTLLYLHGADGNLSDTVDALAAFHAEGLSVFAIDYRGYGLSQSAQLSENRPSEKQLRQDAEWALTWLTLTRQIPARTVIISGTGLGADLAAELARDHSEVAAVLLDQPIENAMEAIFADSRSRLVPAHWLVPDRYDLNAAAGSLDVPSLWLFARKGGSGTSNTPAVYKAASKQKSAAWLTSPSAADPHFAETMTRWLDDLPSR